MKIRHVFEDQVGKNKTDFTRPPFKIRAKDLDENFKQVRPKSTTGNTNLPYRISEDRENGWEMIFEWWPPPSTGTFVLGCIGGQMQWIATELCET
jgi:hypothetical protein